MLLVMIFEKAHLRPIGLGAYREIGRVMVWSPNFTAIWYAAKRSKVQHRAALGTKLNEIAFPVPEFLSYS